MAKIVIDTQKCKGCLLCIAFCSRGLIAVDEKLNRKGVRPVRFKGKSDCLACGMCAIMCPDSCITVYK